MSLLSHTRRRFNGLAIPGNTKSKARQTRLQLEFLEDRCVPTTYTVNSLLDTDIGVGDSGSAVRHYLINLANANHTGERRSAPDLIDFCHRRGRNHPALAALTAGAALPMAAGQQ